MYVMRSEQRVKPGVQKMLTAVAATIAPRALVFPKSQTDRPAQLIMSVNQVSVLMATAVTPHATILANPAQKTRVPARYMLPIPTLKMNAMPAWRAVEQTTVVSSFPRVRIRSTTVCRNHSLPAAMMVCVTVPGIVDIGPAEPNVQTWFA